MLQTPIKNTKGVIVASLGNAAIAMGICGAKLNVNVTAVLPSYITLAIKKKISDLGVRVIVGGNTLYQAQRYAKYLAEEKDLLYIDG